MPTTDQGPTGERRRGRLPRTVWRHPASVLALGLGVGAVRYAPGTAGTLVAIPLYVLIAPLPPAWYAATVILLFAVGIWLCDQAQRLLGAHDHPAIVWDEIVGYLLTMFLAPPGWLWVVVGFVLFRLFDVWKPFPIKTVDRTIRGGLGTMLDDVLAGIYAWTGIQVLAFLARVFF